MDGVMMWFGKIIYSLYVTAGPLCEIRLSMVKVTDGREVGIGFYLLFYKYCV